MGSEYLHGESWFLPHRSHQNGCSDSCAIAASGLFSLVFTPVLVVSQLMAGPTTAAPAETIWTATYSSEETFAPAESGCTWSEQSVADAYWACGARKPRFAWSLPVDQ